jgi:hypothetical protein
MSDKLQAAFDAHVNKGPAEAHRVLDMVKAMLERTVWLTARASLGLTAQASYTDVNLASSVSSRAKSILVNVVQVTGNGRWCQFSARPNGSSADPLIYWAFEPHDSVGAPAHANTWGAMIEIPLNYSDKIFEYKLAIDGDWVFYLVGYREGQY